jgi:hypothetical protein
MCGGELFEMALPVSLTEAIPPVNVHCRNGEIAVEAAYIRYSEEQG